MDVQYIKGVGPKRAAQLKKLNIKTVEDLLYFVPKEYDDRSQFKQIRECVDGEKVSLKVQICGYPVKLAPRKNLSIVKVPARDSSGQALLVWFNQDYVINMLSLGDIVVIMEDNIFRNQIQI